MLSLGKRSFWNNVHPVGAVADFRQVWHDAGRNRWLFMIMAAATTIGVFSIMADESWKGPPARPHVTYINSWTDDRPDSVIKREIEENQKLQDKLRAEQAKRDEKVKDIYRTIGKASGMDVAAIEAQARKDDAAEKIAHEKAIGLKEGMPAESAPVAKP